MPPKKKIAIPIDSAVQNHYLRLPRKYLPKTHNPNFESHGLNLPIRAFILAPSGGMKNNLVMEMLSRFGPTFHRVIICCRNKNQPFYNVLEDRNPDIEFHEIENGFDIPPMEQDKDQKLIIFDDCLALTDQSRIKDYFIRGRHNNYSCLYLTQSYYSTNKDFKTFRTQCNYIFVLKVRSMKDLNLILSDFPLNKTKQELFECYHKACKKNTDFMLIDCDKEEVRHNFSEIM
jgi:hypothetical protein